MLKIKNSINQIKNILESITNRLTRPAEERISGTEEKMRKILYSYRNKGKKVNKQDQTSKNSGHDQETKPKNPWSRRS
jgi:hypothetical protein